MFYLEKLPMHVISRFVITKLNFFFLIGDCRKYSLENYTIVLKIISFLNLVSSVWFL